MAIGKDVGGAADRIAHTIFDVAPIAIVMMDARGMCIQVNGEAIRLLGFVACDSAYQIGPGDFVDIERRILEPSQYPCTRARLEREVVRDAEIGLQRPDGSITWLQVSAIPLAEGGALVFYQDITLRRRHDDIQRARVRLSEIAARVTTYELLQATLDEAESLTGSVVGFYHFLDDDQVTLSLQAWSTRTTREFCTAEGKGRHYDVGKAGIWVDCIHEKRPVIHNDYASVVNKKGLPPGHAAVTRLLTVPVMRGGKIKALLGVGNKPQLYSQGDLETVQFLADLAWDIAERRRAEEALHLKQAALESSLNAVALADLDGRVRYINNAFLSLWHVQDRLAPLGRMLTEFFADDHAAAVLKEAQSGQPCTGELIGYRPDGSTFDTQFTACVVRDKGEVAVGLLATFLDVSEQHRTAQALRQSEERFALAFNVVPDAVYISETTTGRFIEINHSFEKQTGYTRAEVIGKNSSELGILCDPSQRDAFRLAIQADGSVTAFLARLRHKDGHVFWGETSSVKIIFDGKPCLLSTTRDVTLRIEAEQALRDSESRFRSMFRTHDATMLLIDPTTGAILDANDAAVAYYGHSREQLTAMAATDLNTASPEEVRAALYAAKTGERHVFQFKHRLASGEVRDVEVYSSPIDFGGKPVLFSILHDVTKRRQLEAQVQQAQKMESLGSLAGGVAHDMNNILGAILGITSLLREDLGSREHARDLETIVQACLRGRTMVRGLLDFTRQELVDLQVMDLNVLVREQSALLGRTLPATIRLDLNLSPDLRRIRGDSNTLGRALLNLVMNSIDALTDGGTIHISTRNTPSGVELAVEDNGPGMTKEVLAKAQDPFFTTKPVGKGTGMGLAIVYGTMKAHRGQLDLQSQLGQGVRAYLRFPMCEENRVQERASAPTATFPAKTSLSVLLVDDDPLIQGAVSGMLRKLGHRVSSALTGAEALMALESPATFSLVILDLNMPVLDGASTLPRLRDLRPTLPVILATGRADEAAQELARTYPLVTVLPKPFSFEELRQRIELATG